MVNYSHRVIRSGGIVASQQFISSLVSLIYAILLSRALGPAAFALFAVCSGLSKVLGTTARMGINARLLTQPENPSEEDYGVGLCTMLILSVAVTVSGVSLLPFLGRFGHFRGLFWPGLATICFIPIRIIATVGSSRLERELLFKPVAAIEFGVQLISQSVATVLAFSGLGVWGPIIGWSLQTTIQAIAFWRVVGGWPTLAWNPAKSIKMFKYGCGYALASAIGQGRNLVIISFVGRVGGESYAGYISLGLRAVELMSPIRNAASRVLLPALASIISAPLRLRHWVFAAVETETLLSVPFMATAVAILSFLGPHLLGPKWLQFKTVFPWLITTAILCAIHAISITALTIRGWFGEVIVSALVGHMAVATAILLAAGHHSPEGYAVATLICWPAAWLQEWFASRRLGTRVGWNSVLWAMGGAGLCLAWRLGPWTLLLPAMAIAWTRHGIRSRARSIYSAVSAR